MSHELESGAFRKTAWHRLGKVMDRLMSVKEALVEGGADWFVEKRNLLDPVSGDPTGIFANYRLSDGVRVSDGLSEEYGVVQNADAFMLFDSIIDEGTAKVSAVTVLYGGRVVTLTAELNRTIKVADEVGTIVPFLNLVTSHDGSYSLMISPCDVEVVCANTLRLSLSRVGFPRAVVRHTGDDTQIAKKVEEVRKAVGLADAYYDEMEAEVGRLVDQSITEAAVQGLIKSVFPAKDEVVLNKNALAVRGLYESAPYIIPFKGTAWGVLNAVNEFEMWQQGASSGADSAAERQTRMLLSSKGLPLTNQAHKLLVDAR